MLPVHVGEDGDVGTSVGVSSMSDCGGVAADTFGAAGRKGQAWGGPYLSAAVATTTKQKLKEIAFLWQKSNYMELLFYQG